jgi:hypothetical protein
MMRFGFLVILGFFFCNYSEAQDLSSKRDSIVHAYSYNDLLPPEFTSPAMENEYYSDSSSTADHSYFFVIKLRSNCTFFYEIYYKPYNRARVGFYIGTYTISGHKIYLTYNSLLSGQQGKTYTSSAIPVSWSLPERPNYLLIRKSMLFGPNKQKLKKKMRYTLKDKSQFDVGICQ